MRLLALACWACGASALAGGVSFAPVAPAEGSAWELRTLRRTAGTSKTQSSQSLTTEDALVATVKVVSVKDGRPAKLEVAYATKATSREGKGALPSKKSALAGKTVTVDGYADDVSVRDAKGELLDMALTREVGGDVGGLLGDDPVLEALKGKSLKAGASVPELIPLVLRKFVRPLDPDAAATDASATLKAVKDGRASFDLAFTMTTSVGGLELQTRYTGTLEVPAGSGWRSSLSVEGKYSGSGETKLGGKTMKMDASGSSRVEYLMKAKGRK